VRRAPALLLLVAACGGAPKPAATPTLPTPRSEETPPPPSAEPAPAPSKDPWAGRSDLLVPPAPAKPAAVDLPRVTRFTLPNGLKVLVVANHDLPIVAMQLAVNAGSEDETRDKRGLADYAAFMLTKGTRKHGADEISRTMDFIGGSLSAYADLEVTHVSCAALSRDLATCLTLLPEIVTVANFPSSEMGRAADQLIGSLKRLRDDPESLAHVHLDNLLWGEDHVRGWPPTVQAIQGIKREDLLAWYDKRFTPGNSLLAVAGDVDPAQLQKDLTRTFATWKARPAAPSKSYKEPKLGGLRVRLVDKPDLTQSEIVLGHLGVAHKDRDYLATALMNYALGGGGFSSRLQSAVRVKGGRSYDASSGFERWRTRGEFAAESSTRNSETVATLSTIRDEIAKMKAGGPTEAELAQAKANIAGGYPLRFETASDVAAAVLAAELHGLPESWVREFPLKVDAVTLADAKAAAAVRLDPENAAVVIVGKADEVAPQLDAAGIKYEKVGYLEPISPRDRAKLAAAGAIDPAKTAAGKKLLDAALAAKGGADKLRNIKDLKATGKVRLGSGPKSIEADWTRIFVPPDKLRLDVALPAGQISMTVTDKGVWQRMGQKKTQDLPPALAADARAGLWRDHDLILLRHLDPGTVVQDAGKVTVAGKAYDAVSIRPREGAPATTILLDPKTHLIFRITYDEGGQPGVEEYGDYKAVDGVMLPYRQRAEGGGQAFDVTVSEFKINGGVPEDTFKHP
jgi:zinc protease